MLHWLRSDLSTSTWQNRCIYELNSDRWWFPDRSRIQKRLQHAKQHPLWTKLNQVNQTTIEIMSTQLKTDRFSEWAQNKPPRFSDLRSWEFDAPKMVARYSCSKRIWDTTMSSNLHAPTKIVARFWASHGNSIRFARF